MFMVILNKHRINIKCVEVVIHAEDYHVQNNKQKLKNNLLKMREKNTEINMDTGTLYM